VHGRVIARFDPEDLNGRCQRACSGRDAGDEAAAAYGHHQHLEVGHRGEHLEPDRTLAGDDERILIGMDEDQVALRSERARVLAGLEEVVAFEHYGGAVHLRVLDLRVRRTFRHDDRRRDAEPRSVVGHGLRMVARAHGDDPACALGLAERQELVQRAALLE
jgi:hypothetical protein